MTIKSIEGPTLGDSPTSRALRLGAAFVGAIPGVGPIIQAVLTEAIPNTRMSRVEEYLLAIDKRLSEIELESALEKPESLDLFEEGLWQSARAFTDQRKAYIQELVLKGLQGTDANKVRARQYLRILSLLDDTHVVLLAEFSPSNPNGNVAPYSCDGTKVVTPGTSVQSIFSKINSDNSLEFFAIMAAQLYSFGLIEEDESIDNMGKPLRTKNFHISATGEDFLHFVGIITTVSMP